MSSDASTTGMGPYTNVTYFTVVTDTNRAGWLWIVGLLSLIYPLFSCWVRLHVRRGMYDIDDWAIGGATVRPNPNQSDRKVLTELAVLISCTTYSVVHSLEAWPWRDQLCNSQYSWRTSCRIRTSARTYLDRQRLNFVIGRLCITDPLHPHSHRRKSLPRPLRPPAIQQPNQTERHHEQHPGRFLRFLRLS